MDYCTGPEALWLLEEYQCSSCMKGHSSTTSQGMKSDAASREATPEEATSVPTNVSMLPFFSPKPERPRATYLRAITISLRNQGFSAHITVTADDFYRLHLNGSTGSPVWTDKTCKTSREVKMDVIVKVRMLGCKSRGLWQPLFGHLLSPEHRP